MRIFILEDDEFRIERFISQSGNNDLTICTKLAGPGGAYDVFDAPYDLILLDHDLGGKQMVEPSDSEEEETGFTFCRWLVKMEINPVPLIIHSYNPFGSERMERYLNENGWIDFVDRQPFGNTLLRMLEVTCTNPEQFASVMD